MKKPQPALNGAIRVQYVLGRSWTSNIIRWYGREFSHVDSVLPEGYGYPAGSLLGARSDWIRPIDRPADEAPIAPGVQVRPSGYEHWKRRTVFEIPCSKLVQDRYYQGVLAERGKPYDKEGIVAFFFPPDGRDWREPSMWFCDELMLAKLEDSGATPRLFIPARSVTPGGSTLVVSAIGGHVVEDVYNC